MLFFAYSIQKKKSAWVVISLLVFTTKLTNKKINHSLSISTDWTNKENADIRGKMDDIKKRGEKPKIMLICSGMKKSNPRRQFKKNEEDVKIYGYLLDFFFLSLLIFVRV